PNPCCSAAMVVTSAPTWDNTPEVNRESDCKGICALIFRGLKLRAEVILKLSGEPTGLRCGAAGKPQPAAAPPCRATDLFPGTRPTSGSPMLQRSPRSRRYRPPLRPPAGN